MIKWNSWHRIVQYLIYSTISSLSVYTYFICSFIIYMSVMLKIGVVVVHNPLYTVLVLTEGPELVL